MNKYVTPVIVVLAGLLSSESRADFAPNLSGEHHRATHFAPTDVEAEVKEAFNGLAEAARNLDEQAYFTYLDAQQFVGLNANGTIWPDYAAFAPLISGGFAATQRVTRLVFPSVEILVLDASTAILVNQYEQDIVLQDGTLVSMAGGGSQVWSKRSGRWKLVSISASAKPPVAQNTAEKCACPGAGQSGAD